MLGSQNETLNWEYQEEVLSKTKPFDIPKRLVVEAWNTVKANAGSAGVDQQSIEDFERNHKDNLYKLWNRMSSGSYFPPDTRAAQYIERSARYRPKLFAHWTIGIINVFA